jgi:replication-associated recombination protein RarA
MLYEKVRPSTWAQIVAQEKAVIQIQTVLKNGWGGRAFWISGASGTGKTTMARLIAKTGAEDFFIQEYDSGDCVGVEEIDDITRSMGFSAGFCGGNKRGRCFIFNEAHGFKRNIIRSMLGILERIPKHVVFIFTTTKEGQDGLFEAQIDAGPLLSRCTLIELENGEAQREAFALHCRQIAVTQNLDGKPFKEYLALADRCENNLRAMLSAVESGEMKCHRD